MSYITMRPKGVGAACIDRKLFDITAGYIQLTMDLSLMGASDYKRLRVATVKRYVDNLTGTASVAYKAITDSLGLPMVVIPNNYNWAQVHARSGEFRPERFLDKLVALNKLVNPEGKWGDAANAKNNVLRFGVATNGWVWYELHRPAGYSRKLMLQMIAENHDGFLGNSDLWKKLREIAAVRGKHTFMNEVIPCPSNHSLLTAEQRRTGLSDILSNASMLLETLPDSPPAQ